jgi:hypothetical protein
MLVDEGFLYDSTTGYELAEMTERPFPFTMNNGIPDPSCKTCLSTESYSGLWQVPIWALTYEGSVYPMDPGMARRRKKRKKLVPRYSQATSAESVLRTAFDQAYNSNRAPVPIAVHPFWFTSSGSRLNEAQDFIKYAASFDDVYFVTLSQLVEWMSSPVPSSEMGSWLKARCKNKPLRRIYN